MNISEVMRKAERLVSEAHQTASAEDDSFYADIRGPELEARAIAELRAAIEAYGAERARAERERIAKSWDGCMYDDIGASLDIGAAIRSEQSNG
jgi:hypothetical protein